jgi:predicted Holliday junction resolvase-like endonuclease
MVQALTALIIALVFLLVGYLWGRRKVAQVKKEALKRQRPILGGLFSEQIAPLLPDFPKDLKISEARFVGKPIDFLFFKGMDEKNIREVVFVEVKTGKSALSLVERKLRDAIRDKRVEWREYRIPDEMLQSSEKMEPSSEYESLPE